MADESVKLSGDFHINDYTSLESLVRLKKKAGTTVSLAPLHFEEDREIELSPRRDPALALERW